MHTRSVGSKVLAPVVLLLACSAHAGELQLHVSHHEIISSEGKSSLVVTFTGLEQLAGKQVLYAKCILGFEIDSCQDVRSSFQLVPFVKGWTDSDTLGLELARNTSNDERGMDVAIVEVAPNTADHSEMLLTSLIEEAVRFESSTFSLVLTQLDAASPCQPTLALGRTVESSSRGALIVKYIELPK